MISKPSQTCPNLLNRQWKPTNERIITGKLYSKFIKLTVSHVYAPTTDAEGETVKGSYEQLQSVTENVQEYDTVIVTGVMNAKVRVNRWNERIMGKHGTEIINNNGKGL